MSSTLEVANKLVGFCKEGKFDDAINELYAENIVSIEPDIAPVQRMEGLEAIKQKSKMFQSMVEEMHKITVSEPLIAGNHFTIQMTMDATFVGRGRNEMAEICVYEVKDGKVVKEQFFFSM